MPLTGRILRIEKISAFDGDGLRTVVFLKGCPLKCRWCSTPESQYGQKEFGVDRRKCTGCFACTENCPEKAISWDMKSERFITDLNRCTDCCKCTDTCPTGARQVWGYTATVDEIYKEIEKDSLFYFHSGGGVTLSGGECLAQAEFCAALLECCLSHGINTAIETSGHAPWESMKMVLPYTDTLFYDLKHTDDEVHRELTGKGNSRILSNLKLIDDSDHQLSLVIRMPLIPSLNDSEDNLKALGELCLGFKRPVEIQLLPYHRLGIETYLRMSVPYTLQDIDTPTQQEMETHAGALRRMGLKVSIGG